MSELPLNGEAAVAGGGSLSDGYRPFRRRCAATAAEGLDVNDLRHRMITRLPRRMWLQLNANFPDGEFYAPFLSVNFHLDISYELLQQLLGHDFGRYLKWGGKGGNKGVIVRARPTNSLRRQSSDQADAIWIWVDPTFADPRWWPGQQIRPNHPLRRGDWRELDQDEQKSALSEYHDGLRLLHDSADWRVGLER